MAETEEADLKRLDLVRNERLKLSATYLNGIAIAILAVGGFAPATAVVTGASPAASWLAFLLLLVCVAASVALHYTASALLKGLR